MVSQYEIVKSNHAIVLDLDSTLLCTMDDNDMKILESLDIMKPANINLRSRLYHLKVSDNEKKGDGVGYEFWGITRPHLKEFLEFCFSYFEIVAVWSAGSYSYVHKIVEHIFKGINKPHIIFTFNNCDYIDGNIYKPLVRIFERVKNMNIKNTFALDDTESTFSRNDKNGILIPKFEPKPVIEELKKDEDSLIKLKNWFLTKQVIESDDIRKLNKNIF